LGAAKLPVTEDRFGVEKSLRAAILSGKAPRGKKRSIGGRDIRGSWQSASVSMQPPPLNDE
jgi:hypothetical protein